LPCSSYFSVFDAQDLYEDAAYHHPKSPAAADESTSDSDYNDKFGKDDGQLTPSSTRVPSLGQPVAHWSPMILRALPTGIFAGFLLLLIIALEMFRRHVGRSSSLESSSSDFRFFSVSLQCSV
jgi:hypothetical protein